MIDTGIKEVDFLILRILCVIIHNDGARTTIDFVPQQKQILDAGIAETDSQVPYRLGIGKAGDQGLGICLDGRDDIVHFNGEFEQIRRLCMTGEIEDDKASLRIVRTQVFLYILNRLFRGGTDDGIGRFAKFAEELPHLCRKFFTPLDDSSLPLSQFEERLLRTVTIHDQKGYSLLIIENGCKHFGKATLAHAPLLGGKAQKDGLFFCLLFHCHLHIAL